MATTTIRATTVFSPAYVAKLEAENMALRAAMGQINDLCEVTLMRGDVAYCIGQIQGCVVRALARAS